MRGRIGVLGVAVLTLALVGASGPVNSPPRAGVLVVDLLLNRATPFTLPGSDPDGDELTFTLLGGARHGRLEGKAPDLVYHPNPGFLGVDELAFAVSDPYGAFDVGLVKFRVALPTVHRVGSAGHLVGEGELSQLVGELAHRGVQVLYILAQTVHFFPVGADIPVVLLSPEGDRATWVTFARASPEGLVLIPTSFEWVGKGVLRVKAPPLSPGPHILVVATGQQAFSFLLSLLPKDHGLILAAGDAKAQGG